MTNQNFPIGSIDWLNAMRTDFDLNHGKPAPAPVFLPARDDMLTLHSRFGDVANAAEALTAAANDVLAQVSALQAQVADLRTQLAQAKG